MDERYTWLRDRIAADSTAFMTTIKRMHQLTTDGPAELAFAMGHGAGVTMNLIGGFGRLLERHQPDQRNECTECLDAHGGMQPWPCRTSKDLAVAYRHHNRYAELWGK